MKTQLEAIAAMKVLREFINPQQKRCLSDLCRGEEKQCFFDKLCEMADIVTTMPVTYEGRKLGEQAVIHLHYFTGGCDWWLIEKDMGDPDEPGQHQAYGHANLGDDQNAENGYISIVELLQNNAEIDLHFKPRTLAELYKEKYQ